MRRTFIAIVTGLGMFSAASAFACDPCCYKQVTVTECVTVYETRTVPYTKQVTRYDNCGNPYTACVTCYKQVQVPVQKAVAVTKLVKVCY